MSRPLRAVPALALALGLLAASAPWAPAAGGLPVDGCPASMTGFLQNDAGSGRDAGDVAGDAVPLAPEGWSWGHLDPPLDYGFQDLADWFWLDVPPGGRELRVKVVFLPNYFYGDDAVPVFYFLDVYRAGQAQPVHETISYLPPTTFDSPGGERLWFHVYMAPLSIAALCAPPPAAGPLPATGLLPDALAAYGVLADCEPDCPAA